MEILKIILMEKKEQYPQYELHIFWSWKAFFVYHDNEMLKENIFGDGILCTYRFHHLRSVYVIRVVYYLIQLQGIIHFGV